MAFGRGHVAFLKTPNFALSDDDIPPSPGPILGSPSASPGRFVLQDFKEQEYLPKFPVHNQDARQPADMSMFPPPIITDMHYGCAAILQWGISGSLDAISSSAKSFYYDTAGSEGKNSSGTDAGDEKEEGHRSQPKEETPRSIRAAKWASRNRAASTKHQRGIGEALDILMMISESRQQRVGVEGAQSSTEERSLHDSEEKVTSWLQDF